MSLKVVKSSGHQVVGHSTFDIGHSTFDLKTMLYSLIIKLGMFAATMSVVFWIGWTLPTSFDQAHDRTANSFEGSEAEIPPGSGSATAVNPSSAALLSDQPSTAAAPKRFHQGSLDVNRATEQDFDALPGIGPKLAERIMEYRQSVGAFHSLDELRTVKGIGNKKFERIRPLVTVTPDAIVIGRGKKAT